MKKLSIQICLLLFSSYAIAQAGHIMQGVGAVNMSMGGASTAQPLDISGALQWNPASISTLAEMIRSGGQPPWLPSIITNSPSTPLAEH